VLKRLPNLLSVLCLALGFAQVAVTLGGHFEWAPRILVLALAADALAGTLTKGREKGSALGEELDALVSLLAFGVGPAVYAYQAGIRELGPLGWAAACTLVVGSALKLSRHHHERPDWPRYQGLPSPVAGLCVALAMVLGAPPKLAALLTLALTLLMLSPLRYLRPGKSLPGREGVALLLLGAAIWPLQPLYALIFAGATLYAALGWFAAPAYAAGAASAGKARKAKAK